MTSIEGESLQGLFGSSICIYTHTRIMSVELLLNLAVGRFEIVAQGHAGSFRDPWQSDDLPQ